MTCKIINKIQWVENRILRPLCPDLVCIFTISVKSWPQTGGIVAGNETMSPANWGQRQEVGAMKARWLKSVVKHSKEAAVALPYQRGQRKVAVRIVALPKAVKTA
jgi:hypothetical protein